MLRLFTLLLAALPAITSAGPLQDRQEKHEAFDEDLTNAHLTGRQPHKRGISYNEVAFVKLFDHPDSRVHWIYNWDSISPPYDPQREFIPMLWSDHYDHTKRWWANVDKAAKMGDGAIHVLSFNEPDQCGYVQPDVFPFSPPP